LRRLLLVVLLAGCSSGGFQSDWERQNLKVQAPEEQVEPPAYPAPASLLEFGVLDAGGFRFFIDGATLNVGKDAIVRYVLVARSPDGVENVSFEGMRCATGDYRVYAFGRPDRTWSASRAGWRSLDSPSVQRRHTTLYREYFCPQNEPIRTAGEGVRALEQGGHPFSKGFAR
jgi:CNP1-like family